MHTNAEFLEFFQSAPPEIDPAAILRAWQRLAPRYQIESRRPPIPVWARRPYSENGQAAWQTLRQELASADPNKGMCLYIHVPFCEEKCAFCDCYSFRVQRLADLNVRRYLDALRQEIVLWDSLDALRTRPVSTVHFGGGTPLFLGPSPFRRLVEAIREAFPNHRGTEWALETTSSLLTPEMTATLAELDFTRIHVGVQSLDDRVRGILQRRERSAGVLRRIAQLVERGAVVSVDLIYGLPQQNLASFLSDICALVGAGVDGFSLYPLQISSRNLGILQAYHPEEKSLLREFWMIQAAEQLLRQLGYRKTLFNHFARAKDANLYFTFPERGEDCLALGTIADGVFGSYHYRHPEYLPYLQQAGAAFPLLQGGLRRSAVENHLFPLETAILSAKIMESQFVCLPGGVGVPRLLDEWRGSGLIAPDLADRNYSRLTASGSWFAGQMMKELAAQFCSPIDSS